MIAGTKADSLYMTGNPFPKAIGTKDKELFKIDAILRIPFAIIAPLIVVVCFVSAWTVSSSPFDLWLAFVFGLVSYLFKKCDYPIAPLVLAMVIGDKAEDAFRQSMIIRLFAGRLLVEIAVGGTLMTLGILLLLWPLVAPFAWRRATPIATEPMRK
jgi:putative tricarboxylic transport membrane protein